jgi:hypothetical protein
MIVLLVLNVEAMQMIMKKSQIERFLNLPYMDFNRASKAQQLS